MYHTTCYTPFVARLVAPHARPEIAQLLFDGGFLNGIVDRVSDDLSTINTWANELLTMTPLLSAQQLATFDQMTDQVAGERTVSSGSLRAYVKAGIAVGYAACGEWAAVWPMITWIHGPDPDGLRRDVLLEVLYLATPANLPDWMAQVHRTFGQADQRGLLWSHLEQRLTELSNDQMSAALVQWLYRLPTIGRTGFLADILLYRTLIARLAGPNECARLVELIQRRENC